METAHAVEPTLGIGRFLLDPLLRDRVGENEESLLANGFDHTDARENATDVMTESLGIAMRRLPQGARVEQSDPEAKQLLTDVKLLMPEVVFQRAR